MSAEFCWEASGAQRRRQPGTGLATKVERNGTSLRARARQIAVRSGTLDLIVVDYLQLMRAEHPTGNCVERMSAFSRHLKQFARELDWPVIAVRPLDRGIEQRPGVVTTRMDSRLRCLPIAASVLVDARLSTGP